VKIALITIHHANSYGGCLQALASQEVLKKYGDVNIIDYKSPALKSTMKLLRFGNSARSFLHVIKDLFRVFPRRRLLRKFREFMHENYRLHKVVDGESLSALNSEYDIFVCGSDQIWNPLITGGFDSNYFLGFVNGKRCVSLSTSSGSYAFRESEILKLKTLVSRFSNLSFREQSMADLVSSLTGRSDIARTLDPTLLLNKLEWISLLGINKERSKERYIFVYTLKKDKLVYDVIRRVSAGLKIKVIAVDQDPIVRYRTDEHIGDADPADFIRLLANAEFVVTNSFHGTAFALNFEIPFVAIKPESGTNRISDLLSAVGLSDRLVERLEDVNCDSIDFSVVRSNLDKEREKTYGFLDVALKEGM
jgi:hypothetical protein